MSVVLVILDGFGVGKKDAGDCVHLADAKNIEDMITHCKRESLYCELKAHGTAVGLPDDTDMGNSEVGHNALGSGQIVDQGAKLVNKAIADKSMFETANFKSIVDSTTTVHMFGLLSDGNVHSHISHFEALISGLAERRMKRVRLHILTDGRDVEAMSALRYVERLEQALRRAEAQVADSSYQIASGGGRMYVTMDRYGADWTIVQRGYEAMVEGKVNAEIVKECKQGYEGYYKSAKDAIEDIRSKFPKKTDQDYPPFVIVDDEKNPIGKIQDGDVVINMNFRGDRAIEISRAFEEVHFQEFPRSTYLRNIKYYGMLIYDSDKGIPGKSLCPNPVIESTLTEWLLQHNIQQYAVSETHKFGHVTYFWNGNRSGYVDAQKELYEEVRSDPNEDIPLKPHMKAQEITDHTIRALQSNQYQFIRANLANGDMVGHTGLIPETTQAVKTLDCCLGQIAAAVKEHNATLVVTADHGNCEEKLDANGNMKTSHTLNKVPFFIYNNKDFVVDVSQIAVPGLANVASTIAKLLNIEPRSCWQPSLVKK